MLFPLADRPSPCLIERLQTTGDLEDRYGGSYDDHMTEEGCEQLKATARKLVGKSIEIIFSSPLIRARESTEIIAQAVDAPVQIVEGLRERHYGVLTGLTKEEARQKYPDVVESHKDYLYTDPEGESYDDFSRRVVDTFKGILTKNHATVAVVSHGGPIKILLKHLGRPAPDKLDDGHIIELIA